MRISYSYFVQRYHSSYIQKVKNVKAIFVQRAKVTFGQVVGFS